MKYDVVVVGAGTAGANAALQLARRGRSVLLVERRAAHLGGAQWHNGVLDRQFRSAGVPPPAGRARSSDGAVARLVGPDGARGAVVTAPTVRADMAALGAHLRRAALDAGVELVDHAVVRDVGYRGQRLAALTLQVQPPGGTPRTVKVEADLAVDASGRGGALRRRSPVLARWCPPPRSGELCAAADLRLRVADPEGAKRFLERHGANAGDHVNRVGVHGGWSTRSITVSEDLEEVSLLVGCVADGRHGTIPGMLAAALDEEPWIGEQISAGRGLIPLRRPYARLTAPGLALVGDAACQVFPAHGSGIGLGLIAGTMLAEAVAPAADAGGAAALWRYQSGFHRAHGGDLAGYDALRRMTTAIGPAGVARMVRAGMPGPSMVHAGLDQRWGAPPLGELLGSARGLAADPGLAALLAPWLVRAQAARALASRYPHDPLDAALARWDRRVGRLVGEHRG